MLYHTQSPYYQWFLTSQKKQRAKVEAQNEKQAAKDAAKSGTKKE
jgi:hypothetical protein